MDTVSYQEGRPPGRLLRTDDVAERLSVSRSAVRRMVIRGELTPIQIGRSVRFRPDELERLINNSPPMSGLTT